MAILVRIITLIIYKLPSTSTILLVVSAMLCLVMQEFLKNYENLQNWFFENLLRIKSVGVQEIPCTKKEVKFALDMVVDLEQLKFTYITVVK